MNFYALFVVFFVFIFASCSPTYYHKNKRLHGLLLQNKFIEADQLLDKHENESKRKDRLLYYLNRGVLAHILGNYTASNTYFENAHIIQENFTYNPWQTALSFVVNDTLQDYRTEDHEQLLLYYYKALNFLKINDIEKALVECRRLQIYLNTLSDRSKYYEDAFMHLLIGIVYQANHAYNDAFIAYRNAANIYEKDQTGVQIPDQLKKDLLYTAYKSGLSDQVVYYKKRWGLTSCDEQQEEGLLLFWHNGLGPIKEEYSLEFFLNCTHDLVIFHSPAWNLFLSFPWPQNDDSGNLLTSLHMIRIAVPKYRERTPCYNQARLETSDNRTYDLLKVEDISAVSSQILQQRSVSELRNALLRVALKKAAEIRLRKSSPLLGTLMGIGSFIVEKADTRNWQTLPHSIYYTRVPLPIGEHTLNLQVSSLYKRKNIPLSCIITPGKTNFKVIHTMQ